MESELGPKRLSTRLPGGAAPVALLQRALGLLGVRQAERVIAIDAQRYWDRSDQPGWASNSHWRTGSAFAGNDLWAEVGRRHLALFERGARAVGFSGPWGRVLEWGCGGGANAVHFAPRSTQFIGVDVSEVSLVECARQVAAVCRTPLTPVLVPVDEPEAALDSVTEPCDVFLCCYVFELFPSPEYGERVLRIAHRLLRPGGLALVQIKYDTGRWRTRPRRRAYRQGMANMTTYPIHAFWELAARCGFVPELIELVARNELDERYAYFVLSRGV